MGGGAEGVVTGPRVGLFSALSCEGARTDGGMIRGCNSNEGPGISNWICGMATRSPGCCSFASIRFPG